MKAIQEIIDYLFCRDLLSDDDLGRLAASDLLAGTSAAEAFEAARRRALADSQPDHLEQPRGREALIDLVEADFDRSVARRRGSPARKPGSRPVARATISDRLLRCFVEAAGRLRGLQIAASAIGPASDRSQALQTLLAASEGELEAAIAACLAQPATPFLDLWEAATFRHYRFVVQDTEHGPAVVAYRALLKGAGPGDLGRYVGELTAPGLGELMRLVKAQRRVLAAIGTLLASAPALFDRPLFLRPDDGHCYWALTIATTALAQEVPAAAAIPLQAPTRPFPAAFDPMVFEDALAISRRALEILPQWEDHRALLCPPAWNLSYDAIGGARNANWQG